MYLIGKIFSQDPIILCRNNKLYAENLLRMNLFCWIIIFPGRYYVYN